ncbi:hypothetical protein GF327_04630 [Candidatus Woesearchaeota archaeon]|nr:hypothetical protein [Candidatus Woesearchaeota archaeon]
MKIRKVIYERSFVIINIIFLLFINALFYSYIHKLGFLYFFRDLFFYLVLVVIFLNLFIKQDKINLIFFICLFATFTFVLLDRIFRIHVYLSGFVGSIGLLSPGIIVNLIYVFGFFMFLSVFYRQIFNEFKNDSVWIYLFFIAIIMKLIGIGADIIYNDITEDYFELFSLYYFIAGFVRRLFEK